MIGKLKRRFTVLATVSIVLLMSVLVLIMNLVNYTSIAAESDMTLNVLSQQQAPFAEDVEPPVKPTGEQEIFVPHGMSPEVPYESRYFSVMVTADGEVLNPDFSRIISVDSDSAENYIAKALASGKDRGFVGQFRYSKIADNGQTRLIFLDCGRKLDVFRSFLWTSMGVGFLGCLIVFVVFLFVSGKIVKPIAESYEKQKRFVSDAGHEIKTPLTIINANVDLLECDGEKEELDEIRQQTKRLTALTNNLVLLSKMEEHTQTVQQTEVSFSELTEKSTASFSIVAAASNVTFSASVAPNVTVKGNPDTLRTLLDALLENAVKYSPDFSAAAVHLTAVKKTAVLTVQNTSKFPINEADLPHVFDRFYRADTSRNSATGGHGIGLSVAKAIAEAHGGTISASTKDGSDFCVTVSIPLA